ncbi:MAG: OmpA family protein [Alphaproteobacteria bacterium]
MITTAVAALFLAASQTPAQANSLSDLMNKDVASVRTMQPVGTDFRAALAREYRTLALYESDEMRDFPSSDYYAKKALAVNSGSDEIPAVPQLWDIKDKDMAELVAGRAQLTNAFDRHGKTLAPAEAAAAQARYDCWVEQTGEGVTNGGTPMAWQPADIASCKDQFRAALDRLDAAILAAQPAPAKVAEVPANQPMTYVPTNDGAVVYFEFDKSALSQQARRDIEGFVARTSGDKNLVVTVKGHTDRTGTAAYNDVLSRERAVAVRNELLRHGLVVREAEDLKVTAEGEGDPAVATGDGVRNAMNRRAVITAYTVSTGAPERAMSGDKNPVSQNTR